jgi:hypothetical protein
MWHNRSRTDENRAYHLASLEYRTRAEAARVVAWMEKRVSRTLQCPTACRAEIFEDPRNRMLLDRFNRNRAMREMAIFSAVIFLAISSLLLCSCSDVDQPPTRESHYSNIPGSGAVNY